jgi:hypothetical protein
MSKAMRGSRGKPSGPLGTALDLLAADDEAGRAEIT